MSKNRKKNRTLKWLFYKSIEDNNIHDTTILLNQNLCLLTMRFRGETPLGLAVRVSNTEAVKLLLNTPGVDLNGLSSSSQTPLMIAYDNFDYPMCKLLLEHPIDMCGDKNPLCKEHHQPVDMCDDKNPLRILVRYKALHLDFLKLFVYHGATFPMPPPYPLNYKCTSSSAFKIIQIIHIVHAFMCQEYRDGKRMDGNRKPIPYRLLYQLFSEEINSIEVAGNIFLPSKYIRLFTT